MDESSPMYRFSAMIGMIVIFFVLYGFACYMMRPQTRFIMVAPGRGDERIPDADPIPPCPDAAKPETVTDG